MKFHNTEGVRVKLRFLGNLFGGGSQDQESKSSTTPWSKQAPFLEKGFSEAENLYDRGQTPYFGFNPVAPQNSNILEGYDRAMGAADTIGNISDQANQATSFFTNPDNLMGNPYIDAVVGHTNNDLVQNWQRNVLPSLRSNAVGLGHGFDSSRAGVAEGLSSEGLLESIAKSSAGLRYQGYDDQANRMLQAIPLQSQNIANSLIPASIYENIGKDQQAHEQRGIDADIAKWSYGKEEPWERLQRYMQGITGNFGSETSSTAKVDTGGLFG